MFRNIEIKEIDLKLNTIIENNVLSSRFKNLVARNKNYCFAFFDQSCLQCIDKIINDNNGALLKYLQIKKKQGNGLNLFVVFYFDFIIALIAFSRLLLIHA